ncbi:MAG: hypothetical protein E7588_01005 [Ruminococcaceae bacterium]|nr:hypothetical protein [Oscillospiraceae bacterium]
MSSEIKTYKCPCCSHPLKFDSEKQTLSCEACDNSYTAEQMQDYEDFEKISDANEFRWEDKSEHDTVDTENMCVYSCPSCGAEIIGNEGMAASECAYCSNPVIVESKLSGMLKPDLIIPFSISKDEAKSAYKNYISKLKLLPDLFFEQNRIEKMTGIYVPFWLFDCTANGKFTYNATNTHIWSDSKYRYTKTDHFSIIREGTLKFDKVPVDASAKMADEYMDALEPYNYDELKEFDLSYITGFYADRYDVAASKSRERASTRIADTTSSTFRSTVNGYSSVVQKSGNIHTDVNATKYALLPVWILNTKYNGKNYLFAVNGQTGKFIGEFPVDRKKYFKWMFGVAGITAVLAQLLLFFI